jgi:Raf kinase inhibitor-like YbhB/YbcL family protein
MKLRPVVSAVLAAAPLALGAGVAQATVHHAPRVQLRLTSPAFRSGATIPARFTCSGADHSPPLSFAGVPRAAKALAVTVVDLSAHGFTHWTVWNLSPRLRGLPAGHVPAGAGQGANDFGTGGYGGPCPPRGQKPHHYVFTLFALKRRLPLASGAPPQAVKADIASAKLASASMLGLFGRR